MHIVFCVWCLCMRGTQRSILLLCWQFSYLKYACRRHAFDQVYGVTHGNRVFSWNLTKLWILVEYTYTRNRVVLARGKISNQINLKTAQILTRTTNLIKSRRNVTNNSLVCGYWRTHIHFRIVGVWCCCWYFIDRSHHGLSRRGCEWG